MIYVFDTNSFSVLFGNFYLKSFPSLWQRFDDLVDKKEIISVREVINEIPDHLERLNKWSKENRELFQQSTNDELEFVKEIFKVRHFQSLIRKKELLRGSPVADPFIIARAYILDGYVITEESKKPNSSRMPNVCDYFKIKCTNLEKFMEMQNWSF